MFTEKEKNLYRRIMEKLHLTADRLGTSINTKSLITFRILFLVGAIVIGGLVVFLYVLTRRIFGKK